MNYGKYREELLSDPETRAEHEKLRPEFEFRRALIRARLDASLTQTGLAERMNTTQSAIARLEAGKSAPNLSTLIKLVDVLGVDISIAPGGEVTVRPHRAA